MRFKAWALSFNLQYCCRPSSDFPDWLKQFMVRYPGTVYKWYHCSNYEKRAVCCILMRVLFMIHGSHYYAYRPACTCLLANNSLEPLLVSATGIQHELILEPKQGILNCLCGKNRLIIVSFFGVMQHHQFDMLVTCAQLSYLRISTFAIVVQLLVQWSLIL